jgi:hypothetical protein
VICEACKKVVPVLFVEGFVDPVFQGAVLINGNFRDIREEKAKILDNVILVVEERPPYTTDIVAACSQHLLGWPVRWSTYGFSKEVELTSSNHVANSGDVVEHPSHMLVMKVLFFYTEH